MSYRKSEIGRNKRNQQTGAALLLFVFMVALTLTALTLRYFDPASRKIAQQEATAAALAEAKAALIGTALTDSILPGRFPCPEDTSKIGTALEGDALSNCDTPALRIGRLPWRTLGLGKLVDGHGEPLWYAISDGFRTYTANPPVINSETIPQLSLNGVANSVIAIIFSAGPALNGQSRPGISVGNPPLQANYLDQGNADADATFFSAVTSASFNDQSMTINHSDLFDPLEKRVLGEIRNNTATYKDSWHAYPFSVDFSNPSALTDVDFVGDITQSGGLLPISDPLVTPNIAPALTKITFSNSSGTAGTSSCNTGVDENGDAMTECVVGLNSTNFPAFPLLKSFQGTATAEFAFSNVGKGFVQAVDLLNMDNDTPNYIRLTNGYNYTYSNSSFNKKVDSNGNGIYSFTFSVNYLSFSNSSSTLRVSIGNSSYPNIPASWTDSVSSWLIKNNWHKLIYYKIAAPFKPSSNVVTPTCSGNCLSVKRTFYNGSTQISADMPGIIMTAGRSLSSTDFQANPSQVRPSNLLKEYFDSTDNVQAETTLIFDQILPLKSTFNDQIRTLQP